MEINNPHDKFFKETFSDKDNVKDLLLNALPGNISGKIDFNSIVLTIAQQLRKEGEEKGIKIGIEKGIQKGRKEGLLLGKLDTAKNLYKLGVDLKKIQKATNLPIKEIRKAVKE